MRHIEVVIDESEVGIISTLMKLELGIESNEVIISRTIDTD